MGVLLLVSILQVRKAAGTFNDQPSPAAERFRIFRNSFQNL
jgi:hypothetical protein